MSKHSHTAGCRKLGARLRRLRKARGWTLQDTADAIGSSKSHIYEMETGRNPNPTIGTVIALADQEYEREYAAELRADR